MAKRGTKRKRGRSPSLAELRKPGIVVTEPTNGKRSARKPNGVAVRTAPKGERKRNHVAAYLDRMAAKYLD